MLTNICIKEFGGTHRLALYCCRKLYEIMPFDAFPPLPADLSHILVGIGQHLMLINR